MLKFNEQSAHIYAVIKIIHRIEHDARGDTEAAKDIDCELERLVEANHDDNGSDGGDGGSGGGGGGDDSAQNNDTHSNEAKRSKTKSNLSIHILASIE